MKIKIFTAIVDKIIQLKQANIFHRDIKSANVIINPNGEPSSISIIDFGVSTSHSSEVYSGRVGTPPYFAPEQYLRDSYLAEPVTAFTLGVMLYTILFNKLPFYSREETCYHEPTWKGNLPAWIIDLNKDLLSKVPTCRPKLMEILGTLTFYS